MSLRQTRSLTHRLDALHRSAGAFFGIFLFVILFSGCWSLGSDALRLWWNGVPLSGQILPMDRLVALQPDAKMIQLPQGNNPVITFCQGMGQCDSSFSAINGKPIEQNTPAMWLVTLHKNLFLDFPGRIFLSLFGFALAVLLITGWFIQRKRIATMLRLPRRTSLRLFFHDLHSWLGLWCYPWLILFALTGALSGLGALGTVSLAQRAAPESPQMIMKNLMGGFDAIEIPTAVAESTVASVIATLGEIAPSFIPQTVGFQGEKWIIGGVRVGQLSTANFEQYQFDSTTKQLVGIRDSAQQSGWTRAFIAVQPVHYGQYQWWPQGESLASTLHFMAGIGALILVSVGLAMWCWRRMETLSARFIVGSCGGLLLASSRFWGQAKTSTVITDLQGREVTVNLPVEKLFLVDSRDILSVDIAAGKTGISRITGWSDSLTQYAPDLKEAYFSVLPELAKIPTLKKTREAGLQVEKLIELAPEVIIMHKANYGAMRDSQILPQLEAAGIQVVFIDFRMDIVKNTPKSILLLGELLGTQERATQFATLYQEKLAAVESQLVKPFPSVLIEANAGLFADNCCQLYGRSGYGVLASLAGGITLWQTVSQQKGLKVRLRILLH